VHRGTVSIGLPNCRVAAGGVEDIKAEASTIRRKMRREGTIQGGDDLARCCSIVRGEVQIVISGEQQLSIGSPGSVMTDYVAEAAGRPGGKRQ
jgi:hypothetical protein